MLIINILLILILFIFKPDYWIIYILLLIFKHIFMLFFNYAYISIINYCKFNQEYDYLYKYNPIGNFIFVSILSNLLLINIIIKKTKLIQIIEQKICIIYDKINNINLILTNQIKNIVIKLSFKIMNKFINQSNQPSQLNQLKQNKISIPAQNFPPRAKGVGKIQYETYDIMQQLIIYLDQLLLLTTDTKLLIIITKMKNNIEEFLTNNSINNKLSKKNQLQLLQAIKSNNQNL